MNQGQGYLNILETECSHNLSDILGYICSTSTKYRSEHSLHCTVSAIVIALFNNSNGADVNSKHVAKCSEIFVSSLKMLSICQLISVA